MRREIYARYSEKYVKNVILYAVLDEGPLFFDPNGEHEVFKNELFDMFEKGLLISFNDALYAPIKIYEDPDTAEIEITIFDGTSKYIFITEELEEPEGPVESEITPDVPTFNDETGVITIPDQAGVIYKIGDDVLNSGEQDPIAKDTDVIVTATAEEGYSFSVEAITEWTFKWVEE